MRKLLCKELTSVLLLTLSMQMGMLQMTSAAESSAVGLERAAFGTFQAPGVAPSVVVSAGVETEAGISTAQEESVKQVAVEQAQRDVPSSSIQSKMSRSTEIPLATDANGSILLPKVMANGEPVPVWYRKGQPITAPRVRATPHKRETLRLKAGTIRREGSMPLPTDIILEKDVPVTLRDGVVIYTDIFRPVEDGKYPALLAWSPYGKEVGGQMLDDVPSRAGVPIGATSGLEKFEGPDPAYWVAHGYVVLNPDTRGAYHSGGNLNYWGTELAQDGYDFIEWAAKEPWSNGKIGMTGNSWLTVSQWFIAGAEPPHLAAIAPWEGFSDHFRETANRGGIPNPVFPEAIFETFASQNYIEDQPRMVVERPLLDAYWEDKIARLDRIRIPAYVVASYTNPVHTYGTFAGFNKIASREKWLRVHNTNEWADYYTPRNVEDLRKFFDRYLKGVENDWEATPRVRLSVLDPGGVDIINRPENEFPLARTEYYKLYLRKDRTLSLWSPGQAGTLRYDSEMPEAKETFTYTFDEDTELTGYMNLCLFAEAKGADDMDLHVTVEKLNADGNVILDRIGQPIRSEGYLRISHRALAPASTYYNPVLAHKKEEPLKKGEIVEANIGIWPMGMQYHKGEKLRLTIEPYIPPPAESVPPFGKARIVVPQEGYTYYPGTSVPMMILGGSDATYTMPGRIMPPPTRNKGQHIFHVGGKYESFLLIPVVPKK